MSNYDVDGLCRELQSYDGVVSLEEGFPGRGGMDSMLFDLFARRRLDVSLLNIGVGGSYRFELGTRFDLHEQVGIGPNAVQSKVVAFLNELPAS